jgi:hypothetical protein
MSSLKLDFIELRDRLRQGRTLSPAGFEPIFYLVFPPSAILEAKRLTPSWQVQLESDGWRVRRFSIAEHVRAIFAAHKLRPHWLTADRRSPLDFARTNQSLANALAGADGLHVRLQRALEELDGHHDSLLLVTDLEALHPYMRIGVIEGQLLGKFHAPTIFLYPGVRTGKSNLRFLGFYPADGNYRSVHIGT